MKFEEVEVAIAPNGEVTIDVRGVPGRQCLARTAELERALGGEVVRREMKPEAYRPQARETPAWQRRSG